MVPVILGNPQVESEPAQTRSQQVAEQLAAPEVVLEEVQEEGLGPDLEV